MFHIAFSLLSIFLLVNFCDVKDMYDIDIGVDNLFSSLIGPVYNIKKTTHMFNILNFSTENTTIKSTRRIKLRFFNEPELDDNATIKNNYYVTRHKKRRKVRPGFLRKSDLDTEALINSDLDKPVPDFNVDPFKMLSRRFDLSVTQYTQYRAKQALREEYFSDEYIDLVKLEKIRLLSVMEQFVYESRYKMVYAQRLRKKYKRRVTYQLGYCFALMRNMKQQQYVLFSVMHSNRVNFTMFFQFMKMYERIIRLDIDLKDLIKFIKYLDFMVSQHNATDRPHRRFLVNLDNRSSTRYNKKTTYHP
ncbi:uncharacterized protein [Choristoneura fumiferana]|uniref:uncharacterized protein n=1 Tax=Choristoneura fumiferana TaxID=7141 RepID=UPI003D15416B